MSLFISLPDSRQCCLYHNKTIPAAGSFFLFLAGHSPAYDRVTHHGKNLVTLPICMGICLFEVWRCPGASHGCTLPNIPPKGDRGHYGSLRHPKDICALGGREMTKGVGTVPAPFFIPRVRLPGSFDACGVSLSGSVLPCGHQSSRSSH